MPLSYNYLVAIGITPVEGIWNDLKSRELANVCCRDFPALATALRRATDRLRHKRHVLHGCITECTLPHLALYADVSRSADHRRYARA